MRYFEILHEGRIEKDHHGNKFALNLSSTEFYNCFKEFHGAAFWCDIEGNVAFGACKHISIDHSTVAQQFGLGKEGCRGYIALPEGALQIEIWLRDKHETDTTVNENEQQKIASIIAFAKSNSILSRIAKS